MKFSLKKTKKGFTLIELLTVIAIIGILTSVILPNMSGHKSRARDAIRLGDLKSLDQAIQLYFTEHNSTFPTTVGVLGEYFGNGDTSGTSLPKDPQTKADYGFGYNQTTHKYCFGAKLENPKPSPSECYTGSNDDNYKIEGPF